MDIIDLLHNYKEEKIIKLIAKNKLEVNLEELLIKSVNIGNDKLSNYLIDKGISFEYQDYLCFDCYLMAVMRGNINIIKKLMTKGLNLYKKYHIDNEDVYAISYINDLDTFKFFEEQMMPKEVFNKSIERIVNRTVTTHNIELLSYLIVNYKIDIAKFVYKTPDKSYTILERTKELRDSMKERENRRREMTYFIDDVFCDKKYQKEKKKAFASLKKLEQENQEIEKYYNFIKEKFENK